MGDVSFWDVLSKRRSVRKFTEKMPAKEDIIRILDATCMAPSGKNTQNWHFMVIKDKKVIERIAQLIVEKNKRLARNSVTQTESEKFIRFAKYSTFFSRAPILILVFAGSYYCTGYSELMRAGLESEAVSLKSTAPGVQSVAAAMENLVLSAAAMGMGTCWMTSANYAAREITEYVGSPGDEFKLIAMTPLGYTESVYAAPVRKPLKAKVTFIG